jgi:hypothetical protein
MIFVWGRGDEIVDILDAIPRSSCSEALPCILCTIPEVPLACLSFPECALSCVLDTIPVYGIHADSASNTLFDFLQVVEISTQVEGHQLLCG